MKIEQQLYSVLEARTILNLSLSFIDRLIDEEKIATIQTGGKRQIHIDEIKRILKEGIK
jgi:excisionase family DNA binding protein